MYITPINCHEKPFYFYVFHVNKIYINSAIKCIVIVIIYGI